jgi:DNA-binding SARP family transcriptional activator
MARRGVAVRGCRGGGGAAGRGQALSAPGVGVSVETGVGMRVETVPGAAAPSLRLRLLGPMALWRADGTAVPLPPSRKVRALLAYLALAGRGTGRAALCELLWDLPSDPRGELRWCLSKLRGVLDTPGRARVRSADDTVLLDLADADVDALAVARALQGGIAGLEAGALAALAARFDAGTTFCEGLELPRSPAFTGWLVAQRRRLRAGLAAVLEHWAQALPPGSDAALPVLERWVAVAPFDRRAHERLLDALAAGGRLAEGDAHLAAVQRQFGAEQQDWAPIGLAWRAARQRHAQGVVLRAAAPAGVPAGPSRRASLVVMPFAERGGGPALRGGIGDGLAHDITTRLAKLRSMFVIAPGTAFVLDERHVGAEDAARRLDVDYVVSGALRRGAPGQLVVGAQVVETRSARVLWADEFRGTRDDTFAVLDDIGNRIVTAVASQVEVAERNRAILKPPTSLDAWEAYHRGLWHAMRFDRADNEQARHFFETAVRLDPTFARPWAALSFTHFQDAFQHWRERGPATAQAHRLAAQALECDERDPAAHWAFGRALWLQGRRDEGLGALDTAVDLSPNFAHGHYMRAFVHAQAGDALRALDDTDHARALSPFDPLAFGMLGTRAMALMSLGRHDEAADWALRAAARPNAHVHIQAIAMHCLALAGRLDEAQRFAAAIAQAQPGYGSEDFLAAFRFGPDREALVREAARRIAPR